jgi:hypothetical protein
MINNNFSYLSDTDFIEYILNNRNHLKDDSILERLFTMKQSKFILLIKKLDNKDLMLIISDIDKLLKYDKTLLISLFLSADYLIKKQILSNENYYNLILKENKNRVGKSYFDLVDYEVKIEILKYKNRLSKIEPNLFYKLLESLDEDTFERIVFDMSESFAKAKEDLQHYMKMKYKVDDMLMQSFITKVNQGKRNPLFLIKISNKEELFIYNKFNLLIKCYFADEMVIFNDDIAFPIELLKNINERHINSIIEKLHENQSKVEKVTMLTTALKLYCIFGYDNAMKILNNKFTHMTDLALNKSAVNNYIDERRQYRLEHQDQFFSHDLVLKAIDALDNNDVQFFKNLCVNNHDFYVNKFIQTLREELHNTVAVNEKITVLSYYLQSEIKNREDHREEEYIQRYIDEYKQRNKGSKDLDYLDIYRYFKEVDINKTKLDEEGRVIINEELNSFLLGNYKNNNDCLLRLVFTREAFGLNDTIATVINNFDKIKRVVDKSKNKLSLNSLLDVIDICKAFLYDLEPNEQDMTLDTIAKILRSHKYCNQPQEEIFLRARELRKKQKEKVCAAIPLVDGVTSDNIKYNVLNFDDASLLVAGIDTGSCFKVGGKGEGFLNYCLTSPYAVLVGLHDENKNFYICQFIRNGNGIYGNGIDPKPENEETNEKLYRALVECANKFIRDSSNKEKIEFVTITNLHQEEFLSTKKLEQIEPSDSLAIDTTFYSDYYKKELSSYIIAKDNEIVNSTLYRPTIMYYQNRIPNYVYQIEKESDKERIELLINSINYTSIDYDQISDKEKYTIKRKYKHLKIDDYIYVVGNKDWFIALDSTKKVTSCCLPFDKRAMNEYLKAFANIEQQFCLQSTKEGRIK